MAIEKKPRAWPLSTDDGLSSRLVEPRGDSVLCAHPGGVHRLHYWEWLPPDVEPASIGRENRDADRRKVREAVRPDKRDAGFGSSNGQARGVVFCVHGLSRSGRDFDALASALSRQGFRVVAPDMPGRGLSDWFADPANYNTSQYLADCLTLIARLDTDRVKWVGTSMGGLIGMSLAALDGHPIERLVLNDIGPELPAAGLERIAESLGSPSFASFDEGETHLRERWASFGPHDDDEFRLMSRNYLVERDRAGERDWTYHYDPAIAKAFNDLLTGESVSFWPVYESLAIPTLVLRGEQSDVLSNAVASRMANSGPRAELVTLPDVGHAPTLIRSAQRERLEAFLG